MRVLYCHKLKEAKQRDCVAFVDFELNDHIRLYALRLVRQPDGSFYLYAPQAGTRRTATFSPSLAGRLTELAVAAYEAANDR
ncbi:hypothetical protein [Rhizobium lusitanum]|uniref:hypothetical protein n=1 Tax=Rhizobium lusitanum TaxID=293958 RepID=UPI00195C0523|nr:hypothetical protein [Rhizobium lusitanum]MBM7045232.1 hypothetical protein [Rhizobium lusitanum]